MSEKGGSSDSDGAYSILRREAYPDRCLHARGTLEAFSSTGHLTAVLAEHKQTAVALLPLDTESLRKETARILLQ